MNKDLNEYINKTSKKVYKKNTKEITKKEANLNKKILLLVISILCVLISSYTSTNNLKKEKNNNDLSFKKIPANVIRVVDGDTINVRFKEELDDGNIYKVRLIGIDTPESKHIDKSKNTKEGQIAYEYTKKMLEGKDIILEFDIAPKDKYGRFLAYVYLENELYNKHLLDIGYAKIMTIQPNSKYVEIFKKAQKEARENNRGFWKNNKKETK